MGDLAFRQPCSQFPQLSRSGIETPFVPRDSTAVFDDSTAVFDIDASAQACLVNVDAAAP
jgi:hypothetical protein